jgi:serine protease
MKHIFTLLLLCLSLSAFSQQWVPHQVLVQLKHGSDVEEFISSFSRTSSMYLTKVEKVSPTWNIWLLTVNGDEQKALDQLYRLEDVQLAQLNHYLKERSVTPNDSSFFLQWNMRNTGQSGGLPGGDVKATQAWDYNTGGITALGDTIVVAVVDAGMDITHDDIHFWKNYAEVPNNGIDDDANGYIDDYNGWNANDSTDNIPLFYHGTHIAGIIGARGNNTIGVAGINWNVQIMAVGAVSYTDAEVMRSYAYVYQARKTYNESGGLAGAFVVATNSSFGVDFANPANYPMWCALYDSMGHIGILSAGATTNSNLDVDASYDMPTSCSSDYLITVTNTTRTDVKNPNSGYGATMVDIGAPGTGVYSTINANGYGTATGTSMSSPHIAGAVALMIAAGCDSFMYAYRAHPDSVALRLKEILLATTDTLPSLLGVTVSGGRLNIYKAIKRMLNEFCVNCVKVDASALNVACNGDSSGSIQLLISSGIPPYSIDWSTGDFDIDHQTLLPAGSYNAQVTDSLGCSKTVYVNIAQPTVLQTGFTVTRELDSSANGSITTNVQGGTPPYSFQWDNADSAITQNITGLSAGTYHVTITDSNGCMAKDTITVQRDSSTGINNIDRAETNIYPNPSTGIFTIESPASLSGAEITIHDMLGRAVGTYSISSPKQQISLTSLPKGFYHLMAVKGHNKVIAKVVLVE